MQLVAYGAQDIYLTGQPQITFFKSIYRRHTNFALESIQQTINGTVSSGNRVSVTVSRNGDLLTDLELEIGLTGAGPTGYNSFHIVDYAELEIGGQLIEKIYGEWMHVWAELSIRKVDGLADPLQACLVGDGNGKNIHVPLLFWFHNNPGLAIPLIALQYHEVKVNFVLKTGLVTNDTNVTIGSVVVYAEYAYLDTTERRQFAQNAHEYLIEQLQVSDASAGSKKVDLNFNHPVKSLIWYGVTAGSTADNLPKYYSPSPYANAKIVLNGTDRFSIRPRDYFERYQVYKHWPGLCPAELTTGPAKLAVSTYSFAVRPAEHQPSGTCNFSRIDTARLEFDANLGTTITTFKVWAQNYNVLRIMSGMGGLAYSN